MPTQETGPLKVLLQVSTIIARVVLQRHLERVQAQNYFSFFFTVVACGTGPESCARSGGGKRAAAKRRMMLADTAALHGRKDKGGGGHRQRYESEEEPEKH